MRPFIRSWLGEERPKQYCTFVGTRSMLRHTWDRACALSSRDRVVTVIAESHTRFQGELRGAPGTTVVQPADRGTAAGVFLPASLVAAHNPTATVLILPADHFVAPEPRFLALAAEACRAAAESPGALVMLAAPADSPETDFGWIVPAARRGTALRRVVSFEEKPDAARAARLFAGGALWNTMVTAVRVDTLWRLGARLLPAMSRRFGELRELFRHPASDLAELRVAEAVGRVYRRMPAADFSRDLVQRCPEACLVLPLSGVAWSDWGRPERVAESLLRLGKRPAFPLDAPLALAATEPAGGDGCWEPLPAV